VVCSLKEESIIHGFRELEHGFRELEQSNSKRDSKLLEEMGGKGMNKML